VGVFGVFGWGVVCFVWGLGVGGFGFWGGGGGGPEVGGCVWEFEVWCLGFRVLGCGLWGLWFRDHVRLSPKEQRAHHILEVHHFHLQER
jgi:hypothetical protein